LTLLAGIGVAIYYKGKNYDESRFTVKEGSLESTRAEINLPGAAIESGAATGLNQRVAQAAAPAASVPAASNPPADALTLPGTDLEPIGPMEVYDPDNLYEKINGQAEGYLEYKFEKLRVQSFGSGGQPIMDIYDYDMGRPINAFGIFALQRNAGADGVPFTEDGYREASGVFFQKGRHYIQIQALDTGEKVIAAMDAASRALYDALPEELGALGGKARLPKAGQRPGSIEYNISDAFGIPGLTDVFQARYLFEGKDQTFFVMTPEEAETATKAFETFKKFAGQFGTIAEDTKIGDADVFVAESFGQYRVVYRRDAELGGVIDADDRDSARKFVEAYLAGELAQGEPAPAEQKASDESDEGMNEYEGS
jgi:hypothetical protein